MSSHVRPALILAATLALAACDGGNSPATPPADTTAPAVDASAAAAAPATPVGEAPVVFEAAGDIAAGGSCALDAVNGAQGEGFTAPAGSVALFSGWFIDDALAVPSGARLLLEGPAGRYAVAIAGGGERPDVAAAVGSDAARLAGFDKFVSLAGMPAGDYALSILHGGNEQRRCALGRPLTITAAGA